MIRKPDPPVLVAVTKEPPGKLKTAAVQILDYNLNRYVIFSLFIPLCPLRRFCLPLMRFDINDRKGLEIALLTALLTFHDLNDSYHKPLPEQTSAITEASLPRQASGSAPPPPPKPAPKTGVDRIAEMHAVRGEVNDILVEDEGQVSDYAQYAMNLLEVRSACPCWRLVPPRLLSPDFYTNPRTKQCFSSPYTHPRRRMSQRYYRLLKKPNGSDTNEVRTISNMSLIKLQHFMHTI